MDELERLLYGEGDSPAKQRKVAISKMLVEWGSPNPKDQYVVVVPSHGPKAVKCLTAKHAADMIYDGQAKLAEKEEVEAYLAELELAKVKADKERDSLTLTKAMQNVLQD